MKPIGRPAAEQQPESIEFVPKQELDGAQRELDRAQQEVERLRKERERLEKENERLKRERERLRRELEAALRASRRQAAPHSRGDPKGDPRRPGRKPGRGYGRQACRPIPSRVDERITVALPERCPHCGGGVEPTSCETQYQEEIVRRTSCAASISPWGAVAIATGGYRDDIPCRHPLPWESARCSWGRRR